MVVGAGLLITIVGLGTRYSFGVFLKSIETEFGLTRGAISGIFSIYMLLCCIFSILGGWVLDRYGPKIVIFLMGTFTGFSLMLTSQGNSTWQLLISYSLLLALGTGAIFPVINSTTSRWFNKKRGFVLGITTSGGALGTIIMAPFATFLIANFDWRTAFIVMGLIAWLVIASLSLVLIRDPRDIGLLPNGVKSGAVQASNQDKGSKTHPIGLSLQQAFSTSQFWFLGCVWLFSSVTVHLIFIHIVPYAVDLGISPMHAAVILSLIGSSSILGRLGVGRVSDRIGRKGPALACGLLQGGTLLWLIWSRDMWMFCAFAIAYGFLWGGFSTVITALIGDIFGMRSIGSIMGGISVGWALGAAAGPAIGGGMFDVVGNYSIAFAVGAVSILIATLLLALIDREADKKSTG